MARIKGIVNQPAKKPQFVLEYRRTYWSRESAAKEHRTLFVYGDNTMRAGTGGQACIRGLFNSHGVATKVAPGMDPASFFDDRRPECRDGIRRDMFRLVERISREEWHKVVISADGLGTGLAELPTRAPATYRFLQECLKELEKIALKVVHTD